MTENRAYRPTTDPIKHPWSVIPIADRMADAAEENLGLPFSLMCDAWDLALQYNVTRLTGRDRFEEHLSTALDAWEADRVGYQFNARAVDPALAEYDPADDEPDVEAAHAFYVDAAHRDGDHASCTHG